MISVLLLRGINVGGSGKLPMTELKAALAEAGAEAIGTYIQSGNAVFNGEVDAKKVAEGIEARAGFRPAQVMVSGDAFLQVAAACPFRAEAKVDPKAVHLFFLSAESAASEADLQAEAAEDERVALRGRVMYLHAPRYIGTSKFVVKLDRLLGVPATGRNWRTVEKIVELVEARA